MQEDTFSISSSAFEDGKMIPARYTCDGENISPPLQIINTNKEIAALVLIVDDPDAVKPAGHVWDHWIVFNISPQSCELAEGESPQGVVGINSGGVLAYGGPCPPDGEHRYFFKLYGIRKLVDLPEGATKAEVEAAMRGSIVAEAQLMGRYNRV